MRAPVVHPHGLNQRFEFRSMDAGANELQNAARFSKRLLSAHVAADITAAGAASPAAAPPSSLIQRRLNRANRRYKCAGKRSAPASPRPWQRRDTALGIGRRVLPSMAIAVWEVAHRPLAYSILVHCPAAKAASSLRFAAALQKMGSRFGLRWQA